jgi:hypothetical protein
MNYLSYETAVSLKKSGFPQEFEEDSLHIRPDGLIVGLAKPEHQADLAYLPSLTELIENCEVEGEWFRLHKYPNNGNPTWLATSGGKFTGFDVLVATSDPYEGAQRRGEGATAEEAVAHLYLNLALHNK